MKSRNYYGFISAQNANILRCVVCLADLNMLGWLVAAASLHSIALYGLPVVKFDQCSVDLLGLPYCCVEG